MTLSMYVCICREHTFRITRTNMIEFGHKFMQICMNECMKARAFAFIRQIYTQLSSIYIYIYIYIYILVLVHMYIVRTFCMSVCV